MADPHGALRAALERTQAVDYDPEVHGPLMKWAAETLIWLQAEHDRHADQLTAIHQIVTAAGHGCARKDLESVIAGILGLSP